MSLYITGLNLPRANQELWIAIRSDGSLRYNSCGWHDSQQKAIAVQSHGRLIDASESIRVEFYDEEHEDWTWHDMTIDDLLSQSWVDADAPTIIPAEPCSNLSKPCKEDEAK